MRRKTINLLINYTHIYTTQFICLLDIIQSNIITLDSWTARNERIHLTDTVDAVGGAQDVVDADLDFLGRVQVAAVCNSLWKKKKY